FKYYIFPIQMVKILLITLLFFNIAFAFDYTRQTNNFLNDSLYQELKKKNINEMTEREYDYYMRIKKLETMHKTRKAAIYREEQYQSYQESEASDKKKSFGKGCVAFSVILLIFLGIIALAVPLG
ncbi:MAG: hypothetical protein AB1633_12720, partial [Elusimicrobiota bacterium]